VFGRLLYENRLREEDLLGLLEDKMKSIRFARQIPTGERRLTCMLSVQALTTAAGIQLVILTPKIRSEVSLANPRFEDFDVSAGVCGGASVPRTG
jgi:hypothetical protein